MIGLAISNYPSSTTTVTNNPVLSPIPGPMPYSCKFEKLDIAYGRFHMEATPSQGKSPQPPNLHSLPAPSDRTRNLPSCLCVFRAWPHTGTEDTCSILPVQTSSDTATTTTWSLYLRLTATFPQIIRHKPPLIKTSTAIMTTTREEMTEDNRQEGEGLPGWGIWGGQSSLSDAVTRTCMLGSLPIGQRGEGGQICRGKRLIRWSIVTVAARGRRDGENGSCSDASIATMTWGHGDCLSMTHIDRTFNLAIRGLWTASCAPQIISKGRWIHKCKRWAG